MKIRRPDLAAIVAGADAKRRNRRDRARTAPSSTAPASVVLRTMRPRAIAAAKARADADRDREQREINGDGLFVAADQRLDQRRQQRQHHDADEPEPARHHARPTTAARSARRCRIIATVDAAMLVAILRCGAPSPVGGIERGRDPAGERKAHDQHRERAGARRRRARQVRRRWCPIRMAMKVAPSTSALPAGSSRAADDRAGCRI